MVGISNYHCKGDWQLKVYRPKMHEIDFKNPEWASLRVFILIQQKGRCLMCKKELPERESTIHHILSRENGGGNNIENLCGLCNRCHDIAEVEELNRHDILNYYNDKKIIKKEKAQTKDWYMWVYGGFSRPGLEDKYKIKKSINIVNDILKKTTYEYPDNILLKEKYIAKKKLSKYTLKYGFTLKEIAYILRKNINTIRYELSIPHKEMKIIDTLKNFK